MFCSMVCIAFWDCFNNCLTDELVWFFLLWNSELLNAVAAQLSNWNLINMLIADDASPHPHVKQCVADLSHKMLCVQDGRRKAIRMWQMVNVVKQAPPMWSHASKKQCQHLQIDMPQWKLLDHWCWRSFEPRNNICFCWFCYKSNEGNLNRVGRFWSAWWVHWFELNAFVHFRGQSC